MQTDINFRASYLRAARAWLGLDQTEAAAGAELGERTLIEAERGRSCSDKSWGKMLDYYASRGIVLRDGAPVLIQINEAPPPA